VLGIGSGGASAATLFNTNNHAAANRVTIGATATATSQGPFDFTTPTGVVFDRCTHVSLTLRVVSNTTTGSALDVYSSQFACDPFQFTGTHTPPWRLTITGEGFMLGGSQAYPAAVHNIVFDLPGSLVTFAGALAGGVTATQNTVTTNGLCIDINDSGTLTSSVGGIALSVDGRFCLAHPASTWSLT
jgi:hypothetical protein